MNHIYYSRKKRKFLFEKILKTNDFTISTGKATMWDSTAAQNKAKVVYVADPQLLGWCDAVPVFKHRVG